MTEQRIVQTVSRKRISRRAFLATMRALSVGVAVGGGSYWALQTDTPLGGNQINAYISILSDGQMQVVCPGLDLGQGAPLALAMILAEEAGADLSKISILDAPRDSGTYGNPIFAGRLVTADSKTTRGYYPVLRLAGAEARLALIATACAIMGWRPEDCIAIDHKVEHRPTNNALPFAEIIAERSLVMPSSVTEQDLKPTDDMTVLGTSPLPADMIEKAMGRKMYGVDRREADMSVAVLARSPHLGGLPISHDATAALKVSGVEAVLVLEDAIAVVATHSWAALKGRDALEVTWSEFEPFDSTSEIDALKDAVNGGTGEPLVVRRKGVLPNSFTLSDTFEAPTLKHVVMEPLNASARATHFGLGVKITASTQSLDLDMRYAAQTWKTAPFLIETIGHPSGGAYGRRVINDAVKDAASVAKKLGRPVQVIRPMLDELRRGQVRPAAFQRISAEISENGDLISWRHQFSSDGTLATELPSSLKGESGKEDNTATDGAYHAYKVPNEQIEWTYVRSKPLPGFLRGVSAGYTVWAIETMVERIARAANRDPLEWRLSHLDDPKLIRVLNHVADMADWSNGDRSLGVGVMSLRESQIATIAEVVEDRVTNLWVAADVGRIIHRNQVLGQIEGGCIWGVSMALHEQLVYSEGQAEISGLGDYPIVSSDSLPKLEIHLMPPTETDEARGVGEIGVPTTIAAITNAFETAKGKSFSRLPISI